MRGGGAGGRVPPRSKKFAKKRGEKREKIGKERKNREEKAKIVKVLSLCPSWQKGLATPLCYAVNLELACFVCYLKIINTFFEIWYMHLTANCPRNSKNGIEIFSKLRIRKVKILLLKNCLAYLNSNVVFELLGQFVTCIPFFKTVLIFWCRGQNILIFGQGAIPFYTCNICATAYTKISHRSFVKACPHNQKVTLKSRKKKNKKKR